MKTLEAKKQKEESLEGIIRAAMESPKFREKLLADPKAVLESQFKFKFPDSIEVVVHEDAPNKLNIVLPVATNELSELELSAVSGGVCWDNCDCG